MDNSEDKMGMGTKKLSNADIPFLAATLPEMLNHPSRSTQTFISYNVNQMANTFYHIFDNTRQHTYRGFPVVLEEP